MAFKDMLVHLDDSKSSSARLEAAAALARVHGAHLTGLYILPTYDLYLYAEVYAGPEIIEAERQAATARAKEREAAFRNITQKEQLSTEWYCVEGEPAQQFNQCAHCCDLVIIGQADTRDPYTLSGGFSSHVVLGAGRPALIIPYIGLTNLPGKRVLVAWNGSREAARAIHDALPFLVNAQTVSIVTLTPSAEPASEHAPSGEALRTHLARHGVSATTDTLPVTDIEVGEALLSRAADENMDLLVMGAYGHSRLREIILGGTTQHLLKHMTVPVLLSH
jgi:nucleotide-binding universal stress UspA family protein